MKTLLVTALILGLVLVAAVAATPSLPPIPMSDLDLSRTLGAGEDCVGLVIGMSLGFLVWAASGGLALPLVLGAYLPIAAAFC